MTIFCTYCSAEKDQAVGLLASIERYRSDRIRRIYSASLAAGVGFRILSGEYGLLGPNDRIPWYDHLLRFEEVEAMSRKIIRQIRRQKIDQILFFTLPLRLDPLLGPYHEVLQSSCGSTGTALDLIEIDFA